MAEVTPAREIRRLLTERPARTRTFRVSRQVLSTVPLDTRVRLRAMTKPEVRELAEYLDVSPEQLDGPFKVVRANCPSCDRRLTFPDFVETAVKRRAHSKAALRDVLTGRAGAWLTIRGRDGGRPVTCGGCGATARMSDYSEYSSSSYAYA